MSMELTQLERTTEIPICNLKELTYISTKQLEGAMSQERFLWTWSQEQWTQYAQDRLGNSSDLTTSSSVKQALVIIRQRAIIRKALS